MKKSSCKINSLLVTLLLMIEVTLFGFAPAVSAAQSKDHTSTKSAAHSKSRLTGKRKHKYVVGKGSYYHKVASAFGDYTGITGIITLPAPDLDPLRVDKAGKQLDGFSVYMGGNADGQEVDAGFSWEKNSNPGKGAAAMVWRPFARATHWLDSDTKQTWSPGDTVSITVSIVSAGKLKLAIADYNVPHPRSYSRVFTAWRFRQGASRQFKRVDAIDQSGCEGQDTLPTNSTVIGAIWKNTYMLRGMGDKQVKLPLYSVKHTQVDEGEKNIRIVKTTEQTGVGGERVDVFGNAQLLSDALVSKKPAVTAPCKRRS